MTVGPRQPLTNAKNYNGKKKKENKREISMFANPSE